MLDEHTAAVLNSRHGKCPDAGAEWVQKTLHLVQELVQTGAVILSSVGMFTWELVTWKASACGGKLIIIVPDVSQNDTAEAASEIARDFHLDANKTLFIFPEDSPDSFKSLANFPKRDAWTVALAETLYPVAIRPDGNLETVIEKSSKVNDENRIPYVKATRPSPFSNLEIANPRNDVLPWDALTHWTRKTANPWPDETKADFYAAFNTKQNGYPRSGFHTLKRVLKQQRLLASNRLIRSGKSVVSLTECLPWELAKLVKWRPGLFRWTFEPYGIALNKTKLESFGARRVVYGEDYQFRFLQGEDIPFFQSCGHGENNWREEKEWRHLGDIDLNQFEPEDVIIFVYTNEEAKELRRESRFQVMCWEDFKKSVHLLNKKTS
ncbi:hypothetical protein KKG05_03115 [bacterium]|nr:hypothetical protein [bacterium]